MGGRTTELRHPRTSEAKDCRQNVNLLWPHLDIDMLERCWLNSEPLVRSEIIIYLRSVKLHLSPKYTIAKQVLSRQNTT
jgi:hypothetical protein